MENKRILYSVWIGLLLVTSTFSLSAQVGADTSLFFNGDSVLAINAARMADIFQEASHLSDNDPKTNRRYRKLARRARHAARQHGHLQHTTRKKIAQLKARNPELVDYLAKLTTQDGVRIRIMLTSYFRAPDDPNVGLTHTAYDQSDQYGVRLFAPRIVHKGVMLQERLDNVVHVSLAVEAQTRILRHELGHVAYSIAQSQQYYSYLLHHIAHHHRHDGHSHHDHSGIEAYRFEAMAD